MVLAIFVRNSRTPIYLPHRNQQLSVASWLPYCLSSAEVMRRRSAMKREGMTMFNYGLNSIDTGGILVGDHVTITLEAEFVKA